MYVSFPIFTSKFQFPFIIAVKTTRKILSKRKVVCITHSKCMEHSKIFLWINYKVLMSKLPRHCEISPALPWNGAHYGRNLYCRENKRGMSLVFMYTSVLHPHHKHHQHTHKLILQWNKKVGLSIWEPRIYFYTYTCTCIRNDYMHLFVTLFINLRSVSPSQALDYYI